MESKEPFARVVPRPASKSWELHLPTGLLRVFVKDGDADYFAERINTAHASRLVAFKERACGALCDECREGVPSVTHDPLGWAHDFGPEVQLSVRFIRCRAAAIRALDEGV